MKIPFLSLYLMVAALLLPGLVSAQTPDTAPATPANATSGTASSQEKVALQLPNAPLDTVLNQYEQFTGKILLRGQNVNAPSIRLVVPEPIPKDKAIRLIEAALLLNGISLVPGPDNTVKVLFSGPKSGPRTEGIPILTRLEDLPPGDQVVSFYMPLTYIDTAKFLPIVQQATSGNPYFSVVELKDAGAVMVTDTSTLIRQYHKLKELADVPPARLTREFVQLERADAERVAELLNQLIQGRKQNQQQTGGGGNPAGLPPGTPGTETGGSGSANYLSGDIQLTPDRRTNRILVICSPMAFPPIRDLIKQFDEAVELEKPFVRPLKYVAADEVLPVLGELLSEVEGDVKEGAAPTGTSSPTTGSAARNASGNNRTGSSSSSTSGGGGLSKADQLGDPDDDQAPRSLNVGKTRLIADKRSNAILIIGSPESVNKVSSILDSLDIEPRQVFLSTVIGQLTLTRETEFGIDILNKYNGGVAGSSISQPRTTSFIDPKTLITAGAFPAGAAGLSLYGAFGDTIDAYVRAFEESRNFKVLSRPSVFTSNNKKATIVSGRRVPVPTQTITDVNSGNSNTSISYEDVVLKLEVIPLINADNEVTLRIAQQNDSIVDNQEVDGNVIPVIGTQEVTTTIKVKNNNTVILGGLIEDTASRTEGGVPILKDIPLLGYLFKTTNVERPRSELVVMIQPRVIGQGESETVKSDEEAQRYIIAPDARDMSDATTPVRTQLKRKPPRGLEPAKQ